MGSSSRLDCSGRFYFTLSFLSLSLQKKISKIILPSVRTQPTLEPNISTAHPSHGLIVHNAHCLCFTSPTASTVSGPTFSWRRQPDLAQKYNLLTILLKSLYMLLGSTCYMLMTQLSHTCQWHIRDCKILQC
jgi:hypothetical protein